MKIDFPIQTTTVHSVEVKPSQAWTVIRHHTLKQINDELRSLGLPKEELDIPYTGFHEFYVKEDGKVYGFHEDGRHPRNIETEVEIKWGADSIKRVLDTLKGLELTLRQRGII